LTRRELSEIDYLLLDIKEKQRIIDFHLVNIYKASDYIRKNQNKISEAIRKIQELQ